MTISLLHAFTSAKTDGTDNTLVQPSDWNAEHVITMATAALLGRVTAGDGEVEELSAAVVRALLNVEDGAAADQTAAEILAAVLSEAGLSGDIVGTSDTQTLTGKTINADNNTITNIGLAQFDTDVGDAFSFLNGTALDTPDVTVTSDGATITLSLEADGGGDIRYQFSDGIHTHDCTPTATIALNAGSDASPQINYIYILQSNKTLTVSTSGFPSAEHSPVAEVLCQSAASLQTDGAYKVHVWTDHTSGSDGQGHLSHVNHWIRDQNATWEDGVELTPTITTNGGSEDNVDIATSIGEILQLHEHAFPAFDTSTGSEVYVVNHNSGAYTKITDLQDADEDDAGNAISNNRYTSLVLWGVVNEDAADCKLMLNFPSAFYTSEADALADSSRFANYNIPAAFKGVGFLIARLTLRYQSASSGTWTVTENLDLRGQFPSLTAGGNIAPSTEFADNVFRIFDESDTSKELAFQLSGVATATTRTWTVPDADGTVLLNSITATLGAGFSHTPNNLGTITTGTVTPDEADGDMQYLVNGGAFTLAPPTNNCVIIVQITNNASAGAITTSGFDGVFGDSFTTTDGDDFICTIVKINGFSSLTVQDIS